jgi:hypothetical protein
MNETLHVVRAFVVVLLLVVAILTLVAIALLFLLGLARNTLTWDYATIRLVVIPFAVLAVYGVRIAPPRLAARARSQGRERDAENIERATKFVYLLFGLLVAVGLVLVLHQQFSAREVLKVLLLPPVVVGGLFLAGMYADMAGGRWGWTRALVVLVAIAALTWLILQL